MSEKLPYKLYNLIPSQSTIWLTVRYSLHKEVLQIPSSVTINKDIPFDTLKRALDIELARNDCTRLRFIKEKGGNLKQYFLPQFHMYDVPTVEFKSKEEQEEYLSADARVPVYFLRDETFRVILFKTYDGRSGIYLCTSHLVMDAAAMAIFFKDYLEILRALMTNEPMPKPLASYEEYIQREFERLADKEKMAKSKAFFNEYYKKGGCPFYAGVHGHDLLDKARKKAKDPSLTIPVAYDPIRDKVDLVEKRVAPEDAKKMFEFCKANLVSPETLMQAGYRAHVSNINYDTMDTFSLHMCSKRVTLKEKNMGGCLAQPMQVRAIFKPEMTFNEVLKELDSIRNSLYRHMTYPFVVAFAQERAMYNLKINQAPSFMTFTWLPMLSGGEFDIEFRGYNIGRYIMPLYTFTYPDARDMSIVCTYMYRTNRIKREHIDALHDNMVKAVLAGIENPELTYGEIKDIVR